MSACGLGFSAKIIQLCVENRVYHKNKHNLYIFSILSILKWVSRFKRSDWLACERCLAKSPRDSFRPCFNWNQLSFLTEKHRHNVNFFCPHCCHSKWVVGGDFSLQEEKFWTPRRTTARLFNSAECKEGVVDIDFYLLDSKQRQSIHLILATREWSTFLDSAGLLWF